MHVLPPLLELVRRVMNGKSFSDILALMPFSSGCFPLMPRFQPVKAAWKPAIQGCLPSAEDHESRLSDPGDNGSKLETPAPLRNHLDGHASPTCI